ncbi:MULTISPECIES: hypothetical protein [Megamonas]|mgnify:CR=1 FL=1|jgi:hypothetical protein|uniref:hypothetical protein n=2 Tax=Selenomonadaceae TaxID=1843491 RepID=UPI0022DF8F62|nr:MULTISPECIES: hypothetical protein [Megamonas]
MINIFKIIGDKLKKMFSKNNIDEKIFIELGNINIRMGTNIIGERKNLYIPKLNYEGEFTFRRKPNNRINPKIRYITLYKAEKLMKV